MNDFKFTAYDDIKRWEGEELTAYRDQAGVWTIGYGHTAGVVPGMKISLDEAKALLDGDLAWSMAAVKRMVKVPIGQNQFNALTMFVYNIGETQFAGSTALRRLNSGDYAGAAKAMALWNKVTIGGKKVVSNGLVNRRAAEIALFNTPDRPVRETPADALDATASRQEAKPEPKVAAGAKAGGVAVLAALVVDMLATRYPDTVGSVVNSYGGGTVVVATVFGTLATLAAAYMKRSTPQ